MKHTNYLVLLLFIILTFSPSLSHGQDTTSVNTELNWALFQKYVSRTLSRDLDKPVTYQDFAQILYSIYLPKGDPSLEDMAKDTGKSPAISWLESLSLLGENQEVDKPISRIESISILYGLYSRSSQSLNDSLDVNFSFSDYDKIQVQDKIPLAWAQREKLFLGNERKEILPKAPLRLKDFLRVLYRGRDLFENKSILRPIYFHPYQIDKIQVTSSEKMGMHLEYTGEDYIENIRKGLNSYQGQGHYQPSDGWTHSIKVYTSNKNHYSYIVYGDTLTIKGLIIKDPKNAQAFKALEEYLLK